MNLLLRWEGDSSGNEVAMLIFDRSDEIKSRYNDAKKVSVTVLWGRISLALGDALES